MVSFVGKKASCVVMRSGGAKMDGGSSRNGGRADQLVTNAVAVSSFLNYCFCRSVCDLSDQLLWCV